MAAEPSVQLSSTTVTRVVDVGPDPVQGVRGPLNGLQRQPQVVFLVVRGHDDGDPFDAVPARQRQRRHPGHRIRSGPAARRSGAAPGSSVRGKEHLEHKVALLVDPAAGPAQVPPGRGVDRVAVEFPAGNGVPPVAQREGPAGHERALNPVEQSGELCR